MLARALYYSILLTLTWLLIKYIVTEYGEIIFITTTTLGAIFIFGKFIGPKLPYYLGGDPIHVPYAKQDLEWDLYIAMVSRDINQVNVLLSKGANPFKDFSPNHRPITTDAKNCYLHAKHDPNLEHLLVFFENTMHTPNYAIKGTSE